MRTLACQSLLTRPAMKAREHEGLVVATAVTPVLWEPNLRLPAGEARSEGYALVALFEP